MLMILNNNIALEVVKVGLSPPPFIKTVYYNYIKFYHFLSNI